MRSACEDEAFCGLSSHLAAATIAATTGGRLDLHPVDADPAGGVMVQS